MAELIRLICSSSTSDLSPIGTPSQRVYSRSQSILKESSLAEILAEPKANPNGETIDWYTKKSGDIRRFEKLSEVEQVSIKAQYEEFVSRVRFLIKSLEGKANPQSSDEKQVLENYLRIPGAGSIYSAGGSLVLVDWSYEKRNTREAHFSIEKFLAKDSKKFIAPEIEPSADGLKSEGEERIASFEEETKVEDTNPSENLNEGPAIIENDDNSLLRALFSNLALILCVIIGMLIVILFLMVKDACGVRGVKFLDFCSSTNLEISKLESEIDDLYQLSSIRKITLARKLKCNMEKS